MIVSSNLQLTTSSVSQGYTCYVAEDGTLNPITVLKLTVNLDNIPCHSQEIERRVALTSQAVAMCCGIDRQNGTALAIEEDRIERPRSTM